MYAIQQHVNHLSTERRYVVRQCKRRINEGIRRKMLNLIIIWNRTVTNISRKT